MNTRLSILFLVMLSGFMNMSAAAQTPRFRVLALAETGDQHSAFVKAAHHWLDQLALDSNIHIDYIENSFQVGEALLSRYQLFLQLNYPPYNWPDSSKLAFEQYVRTGKLGWVGMHHATLLGEFDGFSIWDWFYRFMGSIRFKNYIAGFASATVIVEDSLHPCFKGIPTQFTIAKDEWYTYDRSPRAQVHVLAAVDEASYAPPSSIKMGDHPVIWSNPEMKARNIYFQMGHDPSLLENPVFEKLFRNAIFWAAGKAGGS